MRQVQVIVEDVERKIDAISRRNSKSNHRKESYGLLHSNPCSLAVIRKEVKAALNKVSSSSELLPIRQLNSKHRND